MKRVEPAARVYRHEDAEHARKMSRGALGLMAVILSDEDPADLLRDEGEPTDPEATR